MTSLSILTIITPSAKLRGTNYHQSYYPIYVGRVLEFVSVTVCDYGSIVLHFVTIYRFKVLECVIMSSEYYNS